MIVVEDGTNVPDANSYVTVEELVQYSADRGILLPVDDAEKEILLIKAMDYLELADNEYVGLRSYPDQLLSWPRTSYSASLGIPRELKKAQLVLAVAAMTIELSPVSSGSAGKKVKIGPIAVERPNESVARPSVPQAEALLRYLYGSSIGAGQLRVVRA
jgi:hypothetical protein